jgi:hypothetical protein
MDLFHYDVHADPVIATTEERRPAFERIFLKYGSLPSVHWISRLSVWVMNVYHSDRRDGHGLPAHACGFRGMLDLFHQDFHSLDFHFLPGGDDAAFAEAMKAWHDFDGLTRDELIGVLGDLIVQIYEQDSRRGPLKSPADPADRMNIPPEFSPVSHPIRPPQNTVWGSPAFFASIHRGAAVRKRRGTGLAGFRAGHR